MFFVPGFLTLKSELSLEPGLYHLPHLCERFHCSFMRFRMGACRSTADFSDQGWKNNWY